MKSYNQRLVNAVVAYQELFNFSPENQITDYNSFYYIKPDVDEEIAEKRIGVALEALGVSEERVLAEPLYLSPKHMRESMIDHMIEVNKMSHYNRKITRESIEGECLVGATFFNCDFSGAEISGTSFTFANFHGCIFDGAKLRNADFAECEIYQCSFKYTELTDATFKDAVLKNSNFLCADIDLCSIKFATFSECSFDMICGCIRDSHTADFDSNELGTQEFYDKMQCIFEMAKDEPTVLKERSNWAQGWISSVENGVFDKTEAYQKERPFLDGIIQKYEDYQQTHDKANSNLEQEAEIEL